ncbi:MAG TPA: hypothetical protein VF070_26835 [Streptosporangiaceae bacterium]
MSVTDRLIAYLRRRADAQVRRANLAAMQHGLLPAGWVYGLNDQFQAEYDEQRRILLERHKHLYREPVSGPDGVAVALWYAGTSVYRSPGLVPPTRWPGSPPDRLAATVDRYIRLVNHILPATQPGFVVQAHAMSGPPAVVIRVFQRRQDAAAYAAGLAQRVRASGVEALWQEA